MSITVKEIQEAIVAIENPGAFLGTLPKANGVDVLKRSGRLNRKNEAEVSEWPINQVLARLNLLLIEMSN